MLVALLAALLSGLSPCVCADEVPEPEPYARLVGDGERLDLEIGVREMVPVGGQGPRLWLVGVVHIGDASYYRRLQSVLDLCPVVLYESVMPPGLGRLRTETPALRVEDTKTRLAFLEEIVDGVVARGSPIPSDRDALREALRRIDGRLVHLLERARFDAWGNAIAYRGVGGDDGPTHFSFTSLGADGKPGGEGAAADLTAGFEAEDAPVEDAARASFHLQRELAEALGLAYQGGSVRYGRRGWRPSDMAIDELERAVDARGGDFGRVEDLLAGRGLTGAAIRLYLGLLRVADAMSGGDVRLAIKATLATKLGSGPTEPEPDGLFDEAVLKAVIDDRNTIVLEDLERLTSERPGLPAVAIFYGAGHMPDFERRLATKGYRAGRTTWLPAIRVDLKGAGTVVTELRRQIEGALRSR